MTLPPTPGETSSARISGTTGIAIGAPSPSTPPPSTLPDDVRFAASDGMVWRRADARPGPAWQPVEHDVARRLLPLLQADNWSQGIAYQLRGAMAAVGIIEPQEIAA